MTDQDPWVNQPAAEEIGLKHLNEEQLFNNLIESDPEWTPDERMMVENAFDLARTVHEDDKHKDKPYTYHLLRNANRVISYLHITNPEIITAVLLHDSVEDHPDDIIRASLDSKDDITDNLPVPDDPNLKQELALKQLSILFSPRVAKIVSGMSNPPRQPNENPSYEERLQQYVDHVEIAVEDVDVWISKIVDWGDNGVGIVHSDFEPDSPENQHFSRKYGKVEPVLEARYRRQDIQGMLDPVAKANVERMFDLARKRLSVPEAERLGETALS